MGLRLRPKHPQMEAHDRQMDALPVVERCLFCSWRWSGTSAEGRERAREHRLQAHPEVIVKRRRPGRHLKSFRQVKLTKEDLSDIFSERDRRAALLGIDLSEIAI